MTAPGSLFRITYASRNVIPDGELDAELGRILGSSRRRNGGLGVTGALVFSTDCFVQTLEGPCEAVEAVFEAIQRDPRHDEVVVLEANPATAREFGAWAMAYGGRGADAGMRFEALTVAKPEATARACALLRTTLERMARLDA